MDSDQLIISGILLATVVLFFHGRWRHDMIAAGALLACVVAGLVPAEAAFTGFGHPAVITVACVLVLSYSLQRSGAVDAIIRHALPGEAGPTLTIAALTGVAAVLSGFMNNVGALALLMPVALQIAARQDIAAGRVLMPLAFGSILGGMTTMIGTPPNLIVSGFRSEIGLGGFGMFDFTPVGLTVATVGVLFVTAVGWRLVPIRERAGKDSFETSAYLTEARVPEDSKAVGMRLSEIERRLEEDDAQVVGLVRGSERVIAPDPRHVIRADDLIVIEAEAESLSSAIGALELELAEADEKAAAGDDGDEEDTAEATKARRDEYSTTLVTPGGHRNVAKDNNGDDKADPNDEIVLVELAVLPQSSLVNRSAQSIQLRSRYNVNLLAISRQGARSVSRLRTMQLQTGDVLLLQGLSDNISDFASDFGCVPLAERELRVPDKRRAITATAIMALAIAGAAFGLLPAAVAFLGGVLASMALRTVPWRSIYEAIDWPVIVLLGALIPVAGAMESTGTAGLIAQFMLIHVAQGEALMALALILIVTMTLSDLMNNAATAAVMCPIAIGTAIQLDASADPFLMAVAIGASCAFLTPIGHQNNTLILGPGGFRFGDYWRLGLPVQLLVIAVSLPMLVWVWPL